MAGRAAHHRQPASHHAAPHRGAGKQSKQIRTNWGVAPNRGVTVHQHVSHAHAPHPAHAHSAHAPHAQHGHGRHH